MSPVYANSSVLQTNFQICCMTNSKATQEQQS